MKLEEPGDFLAALAEGRPDIGFELYVAERDKQRAQAGVLSEAAGDAAEVLGDRLIAQLRGDTAPARIVNFVKGR